MEAVQVVVEPSNRTEVLQQLGTFLEQLRLRFLIGSRGRRVVRGRSILFATRDQDCDDGDPRCGLGVLEHTMARSNNRSVATPRWLVAFCQLRGVSASAVCSHAACTPPRFRRQPWRYHREYSTTSPCHRYRSLDGHRLRARAVLRRSELRSGY